MTSGSQRAWLLVKLVVTLVLCAWIVAYIDWTEFWTVVRGARLWIVGMVLVMACGGVTLSALKWQQLLAVHSLHFGLRKLLRWYVVAMFFNHFLPTSIGGDGYRVYKTLHSPCGASCAVLAIFVERVTGLSALVALGYLAAIVTYLLQGDPIAGTVALTITVGLLIGVASGWLAIRFSLLRKLAAARLWPRVLAALPAKVGDFRRQSGRSALVVAISFVFHANKILIIWLLLYALGVSVDVLALTVAVVAVDVIGLLPITLGGLGLMEGSFIYVMGHYGVGSETGLAAMLLLRVLLLPFSLAGALFYFIGERAASSVVAQLDGRPTAGEPVHGEVGT